MGRVAGHLGLRPGSWQANSRKNISSRIRTTKKKHQRRWKRQQQQQIKKQKQQQHEGSDTNAKHSKQDKCFNVRIQSMLEWQSSGNLGLPPLFAPFRCLPRDRCRFPGTHRRYGRCAGSSRRRTSATAAAAAASAAALAAAASARARAAADAVARAAAASSSGVRRRLVASSLNLLISAWS